MKLKLTDEQKMQLVQLALDTQHRKKALTKLLNVGINTTIQNV